VAQDVGGLEVPMNDSDGMQILKARGNVHQHWHDFRLYHRDGSRCQRALRPGHDQEQGIVGIGGVDNGQQHLAAGIDNSLSNVDFTAQKAVVKYS
jgi:hypothetical protein